MTVGELRDLLERYDDTRATILAEGAGSWYELRTVGSLEPGGALVLLPGPFVTQADAWRPRDEASR